jgi:glycosyltransferase involved in cell wall biosynthesis
VEIPVDDRKQTALAPLRIWLVTVGEPLPLRTQENPRLLRTGRLAELLSARGHCVTWWTSAFDHFSKTHHVAGDNDVAWEGGVIRLLKSTGYRSNVSLMRFVEHAGVAVKFARAAARTTRPDVILVSLPTIELAAAAVSYGRRAGIPVIVDVRDLWPDVIVDVAPLQLRWLARALLWPLTALRDRALAGCSGVVAVSRGYFDWAMAHVARSAGCLDEVVPLGYVAPASRACGDDVQRRLVNLGVRADALLCWYIGTFGRQYDLAPVLIAARDMCAAGRTDVQFVISGDGESGPRWRAMAEGLDNVVFTGWIGADEINWLRAHAAMGLQPYVAGAPQGLANKLFEYLSAGVPVISSLRGENEALILEHQCGLTYLPGDAQGCRQAVTRLADDPELRRAMGARGKALFEAQFDASRVFDRLIGLLECAAREAAPMSSLPLGRATSDC